MTQERISPIWSPRGIIQRVRKTFKSPGDIVLALKIGLFIWRARRQLNRSSLPTYLSRLRAAPRPHTDDLSMAVERIKRLRGPWLRLGWLAASDTCYMHALIFYRFLDSGSGVMRIHLVIEEPTHAGDRLRTHAWVTVDGQMIEPPESGIRERARDLYVHPPD